MKEIGGYIELDSYNLPMMHEGAVALNCGRNCLAYLIRSREINSIQLPRFLCDSVTNVCQKENVNITYYSVNDQFQPVDIVLKPDEWLYIVNYYGQITNSQIEMYVKKYKRVIVDNAQAYFQMPVNGVDTIYTCRKFFGVADGAFLYTDAKLEDKLSVDESFSRMHFLLGRYERTGSEFYNEYSENNRLFTGESIKQMSKLTKNLLHGIDYAKVRMQRTENALFLHRELKKYNELDVKVFDGLFMYPLMLKNGSTVRKKLHQEKIYIPTLWPNVLDECKQELLEYKLVENIIPVPVDQRYDTHDMQYVVNKIVDIIIRNEV